MNGTVLEVKVSAEQTGELSEDDCVSYLMYGGQISVDENQTVTETTIENI